MLKSPFDFTNKNDEWKSHSRTLPWVCGLKTYNSGPTVYACLQAAAHTFNQIIITDDGSKDETHEEIKRFCDDYPNVKVSFFDASEWDPIPDLEVKRDHGSGKQVKEHPTNKSHTKAQIKNWLVCKENFPESIYFSLEDDVLLYPNIKERVQSRIERWSDPETDCEYFNTVFIINKEYVRLCQPDPGMRRRKNYENSGDWTFACFYTSGKITVGPDPVNPWGACMYPWLQKNQCGKKGQDDETPFGLHLLYFRRSRDGFELEGGWERVAAVKDLDDEFINTDIMEKYQLKIDLEINKDASLSVIDSMVNA
jgi:glycosyltransferase involved in cell wall biosynthesis